MYIERPESAIRRRLFDTFVRQLDLSPEDAAHKLFRRRAAPFLAESVRDRPLAVDIAGHRYEIGPTGKDGHIFTTIRIPAALISPTAGALSSGSVVSVGGGAPSDAASMHDRFSIHCIPQQGLSVISDLDDTIKITEVHDLRRMLKNTFLAPYRHVRGMEHFYQTLAHRGALFHYVSASPWQLYDSICEFFSEAGFPPGTIHLRKMRFRGPAAADLLRPSHHSKRKVIKDLLTWFPDRRFVLIGDSTEGDASMYARFQLRFPAQVAQVLIRDTGSRITTRAPFSLPAELRARWQYFSDPEDLSLAFVDTL